MRVGICQPLDVKGYEIIMEYPVSLKNNATWYDNLDDLDADISGNAFFHDTVNGCACFCCLLSFVLVIIIINIINPLNARVVGAPQMILQPVFSIFPVLHCPLRLAKLQTCPFPDVFFPPLPLSALSSSPFYCALQDGFGQT